MNVLREKFITEADHPQGVFLIPASVPIEEAARKTRRVLLHPDVPIVVIRRAYPDLAEIANRVFAHRGFHADLYPLHTARKFSAFRNAAGHDFITLIKSFMPDQDFPDLDITTTPIGARDSHIDNVQQKDARDNLDHGYFAGGIVAVQALSVSGTGSFCRNKLEETGIAPIYSDILQWTYENGSAEALGIDPSFAAPGDITILRQGNWPATHPPGVHSAPVCNVETQDRLSYAAFGYAKPAFG